MNTIWPFVPAAMGLVLTPACTACDGAPQESGTATTIHSPAGSGGTGSATSGSGAGGGAQVVKDCRNGFCRIPAGTFTIGSPEQECGHPPVAEDQTTVTLTRSFLIGQREVTRGEWTARGASVPAGAGAGGATACEETECPVDRVNWYEAAAFTNLVSQAEGLRSCYTLIDCVGAIGEGMECSGISVDGATVYDCQGYRLATEAEWEYASRAGTTTETYSGAFGACEVSACYPDARLEQIAWYCFNSGNVLHPVGLLVENDFGLFDTIGNAYEWVHSRYTPSGYGTGTLVDPGGEPGPAGDLVSRVTRGGAFYAYNSLCRAAGRLNWTMDFAPSGQGLRLARTLGD